MTFSKHKKFVIHYPECTQIKIKVFQDQEADVGAVSAGLKGRLGIHSADELRETRRFLLLRRGLQTGLWSGGHRGTRNVKLV